MTMNDHVDHVDTEESRMRVTALGAATLLALAVYLGLGVAYAATRPDVIAGLTGAAHIVGLVTQVVAWPVWVTGIA